MLLESLTIPLIASLYKYKNAQFTKYLLNILNHMNQRMHLKNDVKIELSLLLYYRPILCSVYPSTSYL